jgi:hypothetical protein
MEGSIVEVSSITTEKVVDSYNDDTKARLALIHKSSIDQAVDFILLEGPELCALNRSFFEMMQNNDKLTPVFSFFVKHMLLPQFGADWTVSPLPNHRNPKALFLVDRFSLAILSMFTIEHCYLNDESDRVVGSLLCDSDKEKLTVCAKIYDEACALFTKRAHSLCSAVFHECKEDIYTMQSSRIESLLFTHPEIEPDFLSFAARIHNSAQRYTVLRVVKNDEKEKKGENDVETYAYPFEDTMIILLKSRKPHKLIGQSYDGERIVKRVQRKAKQKAQSQRPPSSPSSPSSSSSSESSS